MDNQQENHIGRWQAIHSHHGTECHDETYSKENELRILELSEVSVMQYRRRVKARNGNESHKTPKNNNNKTTKQTE